MTQRYRHDGHKVRWTGRAYLLYLLALPLLVPLLLSILIGSLRGLLVSGAALACFAGAARLVRTGLAAEAALRDRPFAAVTRRPLKLLGSLLTGAGTFITSWLGVGHPPPFAAVLGALAVAGCLMFYGRDPAGSKLSHLGSHGYSPEEIIATLKEAENKILGIESARGKIRNLELKRRLRHIADSARGVLRAIEEDPGDIRRARKFLNVYLDGTRRVTEGYARTHARGETGDLDENFRNVLDTIEGVFEEQHQKLLEHDKLDLDVQIEVLSTQLKKEGVI